ncbi:MAG: hypothetical protein RIR26_690 [Pseudomonadota bacterium]|jgi:hypothetical protein
MQVAAEKQRHKHQSGSGCTLLSVVLGLLCACSKGSPNSVQCSATKSLLRFKTATAPKTSQQKGYFSNGGFVEVFTRKELFGPVDSRRLCTAYVEYSDSPLDPLPSTDSPLVMNIFSASHCFDASRDHSIKLHLFDGNTYLAYPVESPALKKVNELRSAMKAKKIPQNEQEKVLKAFRASVTNIESLFNASVESVGSGPSTVGGKLCLRKDDSEFQHVCATYHDIAVVPVVPSSRILASDLDDLKVFRNEASQRLKLWIDGTEIAKNSVSATPKELVFQDDVSTKHTLTSLHKEMRRRLLTFSKMKNLQFVAQELLLSLQECEQRNSGAMCPVVHEIAAALRAQLDGTGDENFDDSSLVTVVDGLMSKYASALNKMDKAFTVFSPFLSQALDNSSKLSLVTRIHSNLRFVTVTDPTNDRPDPLDAMTTGRAFMHMNANNFTGDNTGASVAFVRWVSDSSSLVLGRFAHFFFPKTVTASVRDKVTSPALPNIGFMQSGDSGSIVVVDHIPLFTITSVDGESTSGGAAIQPLPAPVDEDDSNSGGSRKASGNAQVRCR